jgi:hypothetical protein
MNFYLMREKIKKEFIQVTIVLIPIIILSILFAAHALASNETFSCKSNRVSLSDKDNLEYKFGNTVYPTIIKNNEKITYVYSSADIKWEYYFQIVEENNDYFIGEEILPPNNATSLIFFHKGSKFYERVYVNDQTVFTLTHGNCR